MYNSFEFPAAAEQDPDSSQVLDTVLAKFDEHITEVQTWAYGDSSVKGGRGVDLPEILHIIFFLLALPRFSPLFCPNLGGQLPPPPVPLPRTPMGAEQRIAWKPHTTFERAHKEKVNTLDTWITRLKILVKDCNFAEQKDRMLRDQIVFCCRDESLCEKFYREENLDLAKALSVCKLHHVASKRQMESFKEAECKAEASLHCIHFRAKPIQNTGAKKHEKPKQLRKCKYCGQRHMCGPSVKLMSGIWQNMLQVWR